MRLSSGRRLDLLDLQPDAWSDEDLATGVARTYRWGGHSTWPLPLSVAQHSLLVLAIREQDGALTPEEGRRELLHDADEGLLGFDCITPLKPHLGDAYRHLTDRLQATIAARYGLPAWCDAAYARHKRADRLAAISEAYHVAGWSLADIGQEFGTTAIPADDPLWAMAPSGRPWEPWPPDLAARRFLERLRAL